MRPPLISGAPDDRPDPVDTGYTLDEIETIVEELIDDVARAELGEDAHLIVALEIGLLEGDAIELSAAGTVMSATPRDEIDANLTAIRDSIAAGATLQEALDKVT